MDAITTLTHRVIKTPLVCSILALSLLFAAFHRLATTTRHQLSVELRDSLTNPPLYLPSEKEVSNLTLGYNTLFAKIFWFSTLNYFGKHFAAERDFRWLGSMCGVVSTLDPNLRGAVESCATLLSWAAKQPTISSEVLSRGIAADPGYWRYYFLRGFNSWYFNEDFEAAKVDFKKASSFREAPASVHSLAARLISQSEGGSSAKDFLVETLRGTSDLTARAMLLERIKEAILSEQLAALSAAIEVYKRSHGALPGNLNRLVAEGLIDRVPEDPFGGTFSLGEDGTIKSSSNRKGLKFSGKTARTGLASQGF
jgi:hypothetical protein